MKGQKAGKQSIKEIRYIEALAIGTLSFFLISYFAVIGNPYFILISFSLFIILALFSAGHAERTLYLLEIGAAIIIVGEITYMGVLDTTAALAVYSDISTAILVVFALKKGLQNRHIPMLFIAAYAPVILQLINISSAPFIPNNITILGYYFAAAAALSVVFWLIYDNLWKGAQSEISRLSKAIEKVFSKDRLLKYALAISVLAVISPFWPVSPHIILSEYPSAQIQVSVINYSSAGVYILPTNLSPYSYYLNQSGSMSNVRFFYNGSIPISAIYDKAAKAFILNMSGIGESSGTAINISAYFFPYSTGNNYSYEKSAEAAASGMPLSKMGSLGVVSMGQSANPAGSTSNLTLYKYTAVLHNEEKNISFSISPYDYFGSECYPGQNVKTRIRINSSQYVSVFLFNSTGLYSLALRNSTSYQRYFNNFLIYSHNYGLNSTHFLLNTSENATCIYYSVLSRVSSNIRLSINGTYATQAKEPYNISIPSILKAKNITAYARYGFIVPYGTEYLYSGYLARTFQNKSG
jgi:hypothetical protein